MARDPHRPAAAINWLGCGAMALLVAALVGLGDLQTPILAGTYAGAAVASEDGRVNLAPIPVVPSKERPVTGNPLWAIPLGTLSQTLARPVFSPSRRPPSPPIVAAPAVPQTETLHPTEPDHPLLTLLGTIVGEFDGIGIFLDETSKNVIRLRTGQVHGGWTLRSVRRRLASFERDHLEANLEFPSPREEQRILSAAGHSNDQTVVRPRRRKL